MVYLRKTGIFSPKNSEIGYAKNLKGIIKLEKFSSFTKITLYLKDFYPPDNSQCYLLLKNSSQTYLCETFEQGFDGEVKEEIFSIFSPFCAGLFCVTEGKALLISSCSVDGCFFSDNNLIEAFTRQKELIESEEKLSHEEIDKYFDDIVATENYFEEKDVDVKNLKVIDDKFFDNKDERFKGNGMQEKTKVGTQNLNDENEKPAVDGKENSFSIRYLTKTAHETLERYPRFFELENLIYNSVWVTVTQEEIKYYFGIAEKENRSCLCYAVRGVKENCPANLKKISHFVPSLYDENSGFYVVFQDENGNTI